MIEIERKFLVKSDEYRSDAFKVQLLSQAYVFINPVNTGYSRIIENEGKKEEGKNSGISRFEWEKKIPIEEASELMNLCEGEVILKNRYFVKHNEVIIEVDEFLDNNLGLVIAEVELKTIEQKLVLPTWIGKEITGDNKYYNLNLISNPFKSWQI